MGKDYALPEDRVCLASDPCKEPGTGHEDDCKDCITGCAATFREAMKERRLRKESRDEVPELPRRPAKSFCVAALATAGEPDPLEGVFKQVGSFSEAIFFVKRLHCPD